MIFSDGLDEDVMKLEEESELLRRSGEKTKKMYFLVGIRSPSCDLVAYNMHFAYVFVLQVSVLC